MKKSKKKNVGVKSGESEKERKGNEECNERRGRKDQEWGKWKWRKSKRTEGRETREGISRAVSDGFHVLRSRAELAPGGCGWTLMRKVLR